MVTEDLEVFAVEAAFELAEEDPPELQVADVATSSGALVRKASVVESQGSAASASSLGSTVGWEREPSERSIDSRSSGTDDAREYDPEAETDPDGLSAYDGAEWVVPLEDDLESAHSYGCSEGPG
jgi:hypothetical protein